jgi:tRNA pseudouridine55 synthase
MGLQIQIPPMYSAVKLNGQPLYKLARQGIEVERRERTIHITELQFLESNFPEIKARVTCSGGTYIRTLAHDLGAKLGCGAHLSGLIRTQVGRFHLHEACSLDDLSMEKIMPLEQALDPLPFRSLSSVELDRVRNGGAIPLRMETDAGYVVLTGHDGKVISIARVQGDFLQPECVIPAEVMLTGASSDDHPA